MKQSNYSETQLLHFFVFSRNQMSKRRRVHTLLLHMTIAHLLVTLIYMPKEIIHNITIVWWGGDMVSTIRYNGTVSCYIVLSPTSIRAKFFSRNYVI